MAWLLDSGKFQHRVRGMHTLGAEDKQVVERDGFLYLNSSHGTLINEKLTASGAITELFDGDVIQIGKRKITVVYSRFFLSGPLTLLLSGMIAGLSLLMVASSRDLSVELVSVLASSVLIALATINLLNGKQLWTAKMSTLNFVFVLILSGAFSEGMLRFATSELHVSNARVPASLIDSP